MTVNAAALLLVLQVAGTATLISAALGPWLAVALPRRLWISAGAAVPLAFPPTIVCAYFLLPSFPWPAASAAGVLYALPFLLRSARSAFEVHRDYANAARALGASEWRVFARILLPLAQKGLAGALVIVFTRLATEFALTLWIAGRWGRVLP